MVVARELGSGRVATGPAGFLLAAGVVQAGIAARSDEHLALLRQLTHVLSDDSVAERLAKTTSAEELRSLLMGERQSAEFQFDVSLIALDVAADSLMTLQALNAGRLQKIGAVNAQFVSDVITRRPLNLGQGIWLSDSVEGNLASAATVSRPAQAFVEDGEPVALLLTVSVADAQPLDGYPWPGGSVLFLGRFDEPRKGIDILMRALPAVVEQFPDVRVLVVGGGVAGFAAVRERLQHAQEAAQDRPFDETENRNRPHAEARGHAPIFARNALQPGQHQPHRDRQIKKHMRDEDAGKAINTEGLIRTCKNKGRIQNTLPAPDGDDAEGADNDRQPHRHRH